MVPPKGIHSENFVHHFRGVEITEMLWVRDIQEFPLPAGGEVNKKIQFHHKPIEGWGWVTMSSHIERIAWFPCSLNSIPFC